MLYVQGKIYPTKTVVICPKRKIYSQSIQLLYDQDNIYFTTQTPVPIEYRGILLLIC